MKKDTTNTKNSSNTHTILLVEDENINYLYLVTMIERIGLDIKTLHATNGKEAVEYCKNNPEIEFILMDIGMPIMSGIEATKQIREFNQNVVIVAQTAYSTNDKNKDLSKAGFNDFISKPIDDLMFGKIIKKYI